MFNVDYFLLRLWEWLIHNGLPIAALLIVAVLIPRVGRLAVRIVTQRFSKEEEATKTRLALVGATVYVLEAIAYFFVVMLVLTKLGVPPMGAAIPATVVSAAVGFGAQNVIGDFLAGFFIISERQFGLGDYVGFDGPSNPVEGTVVGLTLRSTRLRTSSGEMVNVPNGSTGVITNFSQEWSRAVVDIQIPMNSGESMAVLTRKVEAAAQKAVKNPDVAKDVTDELDVLPATQLIQPAAAGQPWSVQYRITVDVNPARQWAVERAIRAAVANVFWDRMQLTPGFGPFDSDATSALPRDHSGHSRASHQTAAAAHAETEVMPGVVASNEKQDEKNPAAAADDGPGAPAFKDANRGLGEASRDELHAQDQIEPTSEGIDGWFERHEYDTKLKNLLSVGGRTRVSTTLLLLGLLLIGGLALASSNPDGGNAGLLNPAYWSDRARTDETTEPHAEPTQMSNETGADQNSGNSEQSVAPTSEQGTQRDGQSGGQAGNTGSTPDSSSPSTPNESGSATTPQETTPSDAATDTTGSAVDTSAAAPQTNTESGTNPATQ